MRVAVVARVVGVVVAAAGGGVVGTAYVHRPRGFECAAETPSIPSLGLCS